MQDGDAVGLVGLNSWQGIVAVSGMGRYRSNLPNVRNSGIGELAGRRKRQRHQDHAEPPTLLLLWVQAGPLMVALLLVGGAFYTVGAILVALQVPDPAPEVFGYHEVWHLLVIAAVVTHYVMVATTLLP